ncbi:unnamed protein product [Ectocarpus sp. CCAP 1310/34]|nr:unnamed protein product [Ectocarpus sp. CCAP 1310/34]
MSLPFPSLRISPLPALSPDEQEDRHRKKKVVRGFQEVPSKKMANGSRENAFERKHLYGVMGILITAGLTKKPRIIDHWAVGAHDNYPLVRACMPRDLHPVLRPLLPLGTSHRQAQEG